jgi:CheY-like chemotaxis protein
MGDNRIAPEYRVLVVDDDHDSADTLCVLLTMLGAEAKASYDAASAMDLLDVFDPELVIADLSMPGLSGNDLARLICSDDRHNPMLIALSGYDGPEVQRLARRAGFDHVFAKPVDADRLMRVVSAYGSAVRARQS